MSDIYDELAFEFYDRGYTWKSLNEETGEVEHVTPTAGDIKAVVDEAMARLYTSPKDSTLETGRLIIQKIDNINYAIYLHIGDTK